jgi:hypothetical protein
VKTKRWKNNYWGVEKHSEKSTIICSLEYWKDQFQSLYFLAFFVLFLYVLVLASASSPVSSSALIRQTVDKSSPRTSKKKTAHPFLLSTLTWAKCAVLWFGKEKIDERELENEFSVTNVLLLKGSFMSLRLPERLTFHYSFCVKEFLVVQWSWRLKIENSKTGKVSVQHACLFEVRS